MVNENELLEMSKHFKEVLEKKDNELKDLKKKIFLIYGLVRATDDYFDDHNFIELSRTYLSDWIEEIIEK
tara:strand:- start:159 stop:368 length:210 start_codon:yes stop_codon:yes gene_type:complete